MTLKIEYLPLGKLLRYAKNSRTHSDEQVDQLVNSIREFGFTNPVLIDEKNELIAGHGRPTEEAATCGLMVPFEDNEVISNGSPVGEAGGDTSGETAAVAEKPDVKSTDKSKKGSTKK
ncbi:hypothetical protein FHR25_004756 [Yokenella regensburgei]|nr:hypothetical protein FHR25_004756 [Yokenella regensburgei]